MFGKQISSIYVLQFVFHHHCSRFAYSYYTSLFVDVVGADIPRNYSGCWQRQLHIASSLESGLGSIEWTRKTRHDVAFIVPHSSHRSRSEIWSVLSGLFIRNLLNTSCSQ